MESFYTDNEILRPICKRLYDHYRVENLEELVKQLREEGVTITDSIESVEYGKFVHILDNEGNKIELWEPDDIEYDRIVTGRIK